MAVTAAPRRFAFVFPMASGHINPSLPVARSLVALGHEVHYLCREQMREAIEDTGSVFHSEMEQMPELYNGRECDIFGAGESLKREYGLENDSFVTGVFKLRTLSIELMLPGTIRWLRAINAGSVLYSPVMNGNAAFAAEVLGIPSVALLPNAGPGSIQRFFAELLRTSHMTEDMFVQEVEAFEPHHEAVARLNAKYGLDFGLLTNMQPFGKLGVLTLSAITLVTTCEDLQDPMTPDIAEFYKKEGTIFEAVGPLLDKAGARRAAGHKFNASEGDSKHAAKHTGGEVDAEDLLQRVRAARAIGRSTILVSMGTVITGDSPDIGWEGRPKDKNGNCRGLTGRELCRAAWAGAFDAFGESSSEKGPLLIVSLGPQADPFGELEPPANAVCLSVVPQVDVLRLGVDAFLTHGGQNSFTEGLACGVPLLVCPGFGDQVVNAEKAEVMGVGKQVPRPDPDAGHEAAAAAQYRADVAERLRCVFSEKAYLAEARECAGRLQRAGGVPRAVEVMLTLAKGGAPPTSTAETEMVIEAKSNSAVGGA